MKTNKKLKKRLKKLEQMVAGVQQTVVLLTAKVLRPKKTK